MRSVPAHVEEELRDSLECGILCFGFARRAMHDLRPRVRDRGPAQPGTAAMGTLCVPIGCQAGHGHRPAALCLQQGPLLTNTRGKPHTNADLAPSQYDFGAFADSASRINDNGGLSPHAANLGIEARW